jgi:hypothetical protein
VLWVATGAERTGAAAGGFGARGGDFDEIADRVALAVLALRGANLDLDADRDQVQLFAVADLHLAGRTAQRRQGALRDLDGVGVGVDQVEPVVELAAGMRAFQHVEFEEQVLAQTVLGDAHFAAHDLHAVRPGRQDFEGGGGIDGRSVEGVTEGSHGVSPLRWEEVIQGWTSAPFRLFGMACAKAGQSSGKVSGRP